MDECCLKEVLARIPLFVRGEKTSSLHFAAHLSCVRYPLLVSDACTSCGSLPSRAHSATECTEER
eukprot:6492073-Amphidinium_carterae.3